MEIKTIDVDKIIQYQFNNKIHTKEQIDRIANSINLFGFNQPIVLDENNIILVGHGRYLAAIKLNLKTVPCVRKEGLTDAQKKAYRIIDNKTASDTTYDYNNLELELRSIEEMGLDCSEFHFEEFHFPEEPSTEKEEEKEDKTGQWVGQIKLKVPAEEIDHFEADLDELIKKYDGVSKQVKRIK